MKTILADGRWSGAHGIARFSTEVLTRLPSLQLITQGPKPLSLKNIFWQPYEIYQHRKLAKLFFTPGFNPPIYSAMPFIFTLHDLIHVHTKAEFHWRQKIYYQHVIKPALRKAYKVFTDSNYSKEDIIEWSDIPPEKIVVVGCGVNQEFCEHGQRFTAQNPYFLYVGNHKPHKNIFRLLKSFAHANIPQNIQLVFSGIATDEIQKIATQLKISERIIFAGNLSDQELAAYYRGALALVFPSLYEGFGLPALEAMACGTPVITSNVTSLPEVVGDAALLVDPYCVDAIADAIEKIVADENLRHKLSEKGLVRAKVFSWEKTVGIMQKVFDEV